MVVLEGVNTGYRKRSGELRGSGMSGLPVNFGTLSAACN
jgi:hypothetical protein